MQVNMGVEDNREALVYREFPGIYEEGEVGTEAINVQTTACSLYEALTKWAQDPNIDNKADMVSCGEASQEALVNFIKVVESCSYKTDYDKAYLIGGIIVRLDDDRAACLQATPNGDMLSYASVGVDKELRTNNYANDVLNCLTMGKTWPKKYVVHTLTYSIKT